MQNNDEEIAKDDVESIHPDSKYDNWTIRSFVSYRTTSWSQHNLALLH